MENQNGVMQLHMLQMTRNCTPLWWQNSYAMRNRQWQVFSLNKILFKAVSLTDMPQPYTLPFDHYPLTCQKWGSYGKKINEDCLFSIYYETLAGHNLCCAYILLWKNHQKIFNTFDIYYNLILVVYGLQIIIIFLPCQAYTFKLVQHFNLTWTSQETALCLLYVFGVSWL